MTLSVLPARAFAVNFHSPLTASLLDVAAMQPDNFDIPKSDTNYQSEDRLIANGFEI